MMIGEGEWVSVVCVCVWRTQKRKEDKQWTIATAYDNSWAKYVSVDGRWSEVVGSVFYETLYTMDTKIRVWVWARHRTEKRFAEQHIQYYVWRQNEVTLWLVKLSLLLLLLLVLVCDVHGFIVEHIYFVSTLPYPCVWHQPLSSNWPIRWHLVTSARRPLIRGICLLRWMSMFRSKMLRAKFIRNSLCDKKLIIFNGSHRRTE